jgi:poly-beta-1,6-N-acetyl-D-glucosamine synthase
MLISILAVSLSISFILYVIAGYPMLLAKLAKRGQPVTKRWSPKSVSIVVAVRNGEQFIREKIESILKIDYPAELREIVIVSDGSTDRTEVIVSEYHAQGVKLMQIAASGKAAALNKAIPLTSGEILLLTDVRQLIDPPSLRALIENFADPTVGAVSGHLLIGRGDTRAESNIGMYWRYETWIRDNLSSVDSIFGATGPFYAIRRELAVRIPQDALLDDVFMPMAAFFRGYRLIVDPRARAFDVPTPLAVEFQRKVRTLAGNYQLLGYYPRLLGPGNRMWFHYVSYKVGRLLLPFALILLFCSSFGLPNHWAAVFLAGQLGFYALAVFDRLVPEGYSLKRYSSPARTFTTMMVAALCALSVFVRPARSLWIVTGSVIPVGQAKAEAARQA